MLILYDVCYSDCKIKNKKSKTNGGIMVRFTTTYTINAYYH